MVEPPFFIASDNIWRVYFIILLNSSSVNKHDFFKGFIFDKNNISSAYILPIPVIIDWSNNTVFIGSFLFLYFSFK